MKGKLTNLIVILFCFWIAFLAIIGISWVIGFYANGLTHTRYFDIASCTVAIGTAGSALGSILMMAITNFLHDREKTKRYKIDSKCNSIAGQKPQTKGQGMGNGENSRDY